MDRNIFPVWKKWLWSLNSAAAFKCKQGDGVLKLLRIESEEAENVLK